MGTSKESLLSVYRRLLLARECEEAIRKDYAGNEMKTPVHLGIGGEAIPVGVCEVLPKSTAYFATYRNHAAFLALSNDTDSFFGEMYGRVTGAGKGKAGSMHLACPEHGLVATSAVVGTTIPLAVGAALAKKYKNEPGIAVAFLGDGAVEEGVFWESVNFATLHQLPVLFVVEDNELAIHTFKKERQGFKSLDKIVEQFEIPVGFSEGWDVEKVMAETNKVHQKMSATGGPGFLHFAYFRFLEHVGPNEDFGAGYRQKPEEIVAKHDPIFWAERSLEKAGVTAAECSEIKKSIHAQIAASVEAAKRAPFPSAQELFTDVYAESFEAMGEKDREQLFPASFHSRDSVKLSEFRGYDA